MHHWQDIVLAISIFGFNIALLPTVLGKSKPALSSSVITATFLIANVVVYVSLSLWYSVVMSTINTSLWLVLAIQEFKNSKTSGRKK